jgi:hypothetical protein
MTNWCKETHCSMHSLQVSLYTLLLRTLQCLFTHCYCACCSVSLYTATAHAQIYWPCNFCVKLLHFIRHMPTALCVCVCVCVCVCIYIYIYIYTICTVPNNLHWITFKFLPTQELIIIATTPPVTATTPPVTATTPSVTATTPSVTATYCCHIFFKELLKPYAKCHWHHWLPKINK